VHLVHLEPSGVSGLAPEGAPIPCPIALNTFNRWDVCQTGTTTLVATLEDGAGTESYEIGLETWQSLSPFSPLVNAGITVTDIKNTGDVPELDPVISVTVQCDLCADLIPLTVAKGTVLTGATGSTLETVPVIPRAPPVWPNLSYQISATAPGVGADAESWQIPLLLRCDDAFPATWLPGCVFTNFVPVVDFSKLTKIAVGIRKVQGRGSHLGKPGSGNPLNRTSSQKETDNNRAKLCAKRKHPDPTLSCDEYPVAASAQGGFNSPPVDRIWQWVPLTENNLQGTILETFFYKNRILRNNWLPGSETGDPFYVYAG
jgi:hypothetical protein